MKKGILILWLVGAATYTVYTLFIAGPKSPSPPPPSIEHLSSDQAGNRPSSSWDPYLRGHRPIQPTPQPATPPVSAVTDDHQHAPLRETPLEAARNAPAPSTTEDESTASAEENWVKVILPAKLHSASDISSSIVTYYAPGTVLRAESTKDGWVETVNPATQSRGWILEQYLSFSGSPEQTRPMQRVPQTIAQRVAPLPDTSPTLAPSALNTKLAEWEPQTRPTSHERRHRRLGLLGLFRRF